VTPEGGLLFIPSGTPYGPYERPVGIELLQVEFEGADGSPFADIDQLAATREQLSEQGTFENGMFTWVDRDGARQTQPEFRAVLEAATGRPQATPRTRYSVPIELVPEHFSWMPISSTAMAREFVVFPERGTRLWQLAVSGPGPHRVRAVQETLLFVSSGAGRANGEPIAERDSVRLAAGDDIDSDSDSDSRIELFALDLPRPIENGSPRHAEVQR